MKQTIYICCFCCLWALSSRIMQAQVSIGGAGEPAKGMLLQVKDVEPNYDNVQNANDLTNVTAIKGGIALPRVKLANVNSLAPFITTMTPDSKKSHVGLIVFNINEDIEICPGLYVWTGNSWSLLKVSELNTQYFTDNRDGEEYAYRSFGLSGYWMTENLRASKYSDGTTLVANSSFAPNKNNANQKYGLLYNWAAATRNKVSANDQGNQITPATKGICPDGWHLPSDFEWNQLEEFISNEQTARFTKQFYKPILWNASWGTSQTTSRGTHGKAMKSTDAIDNKESAGMSKSVICGGFNSLLVGSLDNSATAVDFGTSSTYWTSSTQSPTSGWSRKLEGRSDGVIRKGAINQEYNAVRCKKD